MSQQWTAVPVLGLVKGTLCPDDELGTLQMQATSQRSRRGAQTQLAYDHDLDFSYKREAHLPPSGRGQGSDFPPLSTRARSAGPLGTWVRFSFDAPSMGTKSHDSQWALYAVKRGADAEARCRRRPPPCKNCAKTSLLQVSVASGWLKGITPAARLLPPARPAPPAWPAAGAPSRSGCRSTCRSGASPPARATRRGWAAQRPRLRRP